MIEAIVSMLITVVIGAAAFMAIRSGSSARSLEDARHTLIRDLGVAKEMIREDLNKAVVTTGKMQSLFNNGEREFAGLNIVPAQNNQPMKVVMYQEHFPGMQIIPTITQTTGQSGFTTFSAKLNNLSLSPDIIAYFSSAVPFYEYYFAKSATKATAANSPYLQGSNASLTLLFKRTSETSTGHNISIKTTTLNAIGAEIPVSALNGTFILTPARRVTYFVNNQGQLVRQVFYAQGSAKNESQVIAENIADLNLKLTFGNHLSPGAQLLPPTSGWPVSSIPYATTQGDCINGTSIPAGFRCPEPADLSSITLSLRGHSDKPVVGATQSSDMFDAQGRLLRDEIMTFAPERYLHLTSEATGVPTGCLPLEANRCKPSCSVYFTAQWGDYGTPPNNWMGYGQYVTDNSLEAAESASKFCRAGVVNLGTEDPATGAPLFIDPISNYDAWVAAITAKAGGASNFPGTLSKRWFAFDAETKDVLTAATEHWSMDWSHSFWINPLAMVANTFLQPRDLFFKRLKRIDGDGNVVASGEWIFVFNNPFNPLASSRSATSYPLTTRERWQDFEHIMDEMVSGTVYDINDETNPWMSLPSGTPFTPAEVSDAGAINAWAAADSVNKGRYFACESSMLYGQAILSGLYPNASCNSEISAGLVTCPVQLICGCRVWRQDQNGTSTNQPIIPVFSDPEWQSNLDVNASSVGNPVRRNPLTCSNTWTTDNGGAYRLKSDANPQGLAIERAALIACHMEPASFPTPTHVQVSGTMNDNGFFTTNFYSRNADFRMRRDQIPPTQIPAPPNWSAFNTDAVFSSRPRAGSYVGRPVPAFKVEESPGVISDGLGLLPSGIECDELTFGSNYDWMGLSICSGSTSTWTPPAGSEQYAPLSGYCRAKDPTTSCEYYDLGDITRIRRIINGLDPNSNAALPVNCGGTDSGGSQGL